MHPGAAATSCEGSAPQVLELHAALILHGIPHPPQLPVSIVVSTHWGASPPS
jgi:hypothetical protein